MERALRDPDSLFYHYQRLIQLRKEHDVLVWGEYQMLLAEHLQVFSYQRFLHDCRLIVIANFSGEPAELTLPEGLRHVSGKCLIANYALRNSLKEKLSLHSREAFMLMPERL
ncbi:alpha-glucosidase C-terminal domain-containing protein [Pantoea sp.]|uniref:alpha-glucosidase C-terminal domain-containing protein n=1 Tax=Pantoea sp. TaxID=69393 RepID=UPI00289CA433|nr:alpha-glucosidase C-terminal domain-containing protein [Pantoea sp.]